MEMYLIKSAGCLAVLLLFYKLLLEEENMHVFKRYYLLISVVAAIVIPLITFTTYVEPASENLNAFIYSPEVSPEVIAKNTNYLPYIFFGIYLLGMLFFSIKFFRNLRSLIVKIRINPKLRSNNFINVLLSEKIQPHTFFNYIFFNKEKYLQDEIPQDVKIHEEAHARQKHSLDVLFVELLQIIFWFNPLIFLLKDAVKMNHEFLADREVIKKGISTSGYQQTLLAYSSRDLQCDLVNPINYSSTRLTVFGKTFSFGKFGQVKKRFTVMKTKTSKKGIFARTLLTLPLLAILLYSFSTTEVVQQEISQENGKIDNQEFYQEIVTPEMIKEYNRLVSRANKDKMLKLPESKRILHIESLLKPQQKENVVQREFKILEFPEFQEKATPKMIAKYNKMAAKYPPESWPALIQKQEYKEMQKIYKIMTPEQKRQAKTFPELEIIEIVEDPVKEATPEMIAEYDKLVQHYNSSSQQPPIIKKMDVDRIRYIYSKMSIQQKQAAEKLDFNFPPPPPPNEKLVAEYDELAKQFNSLPEGTEVSKRKDFSRLIWIYGIMSPEQKANSEKFPFHLLPPPPPPPLPPAPVAKASEKKTGSKIVNEKQIILPPIPPVNEPVIITVVEDAPPSPPQPPAPPAPPTFEKLFADGAIFNYNGKIIEPEIARNLVEVQKSVNVQITYTDDGKPIVKMTDKKDND